TQLFQVIAHVLLVKAGLLPARSVAVHWPKPGRIRRERLVNKHQLVLADAKLKFGVGNDNAALGGVSRGLLIEPQTGETDGLGPFTAYDADHTLERDVFVVLALRGFGGRSEYRAGQAGRPPQSVWQRDAAYRAGLLVLLPSRAAQVSAHHGSAG